MNLYRKINDSKLINKKNTKILLIIVTVLCLIPLFVISFYNFPSADDYNSSILAYQGYLRDGLIGVFKGVIDNIVSSYNSWQGTYSGALVAPLNPFIFGEQYYTLTSIFLISLFLFSLCQLIKYVFYSIQLLFICGILKQLDNPKKSRMIKLMFYSIFVSGGHYVIILNNLILLAFLLGYLIYKKNDKYKIVLFLFITSLVGFSFNVFAPGNFVRIAQNEKMNPILAIVTSFFAATKKIDVWTNIIVILGLIFCLYITYPTLNKTKLKFKNPIIFTIMAFCIFSAIFTPPLYAISSIGPLRVHNIAYYNLILYLFVVMYYWMGYIRNNFMSAKLENKINSMIIKNKVTLLVCFITIFGMNLIVNYSSLSTYKAFISLYNGEAKVYKEQMEERIKLYHDPNIKNVEVEELLYKPEAIFFDDIEDINNWKNNSLASYYGKESVSFKK